MIENNGACVKHALNIVATFYDTHSKYRLDKEVSSTQEAINWYNDTYNHYICDFCFPESIVPESLMYSVNYLLDAREFELLFRVFSVAMYIDLSGTLMIAILHEIKDRYKSLGLTLFISKRIYRIMDSKTINRVDTAILYIFSLAYNMETISADNLAIVIANYKIMEMYRFVNSATRNEEFTKFIIQTLDFNIIRDEEIR